MLIAQQTEEIVEMNIEDDCMINEVMIKLTD
jgi:hypothetical protein